MCLTVRDTVKSLRDLKYDTEDKQTNKKTLLHSGCVTVQNNPVQTSFSLTHEDMDLTLQRGDGWHTGQIDK